MIRLLAGFKTQNVNEVPTVIHIGDNGAVLQDVASQQGGKGFVRLRWFQLDGGIPVSVPAVKATAVPTSDEQAKKDAEKAKAKADADAAEAKAKADAEKAARKAADKAKKDAEKAAKHKPE